MEWPVLFAAGGFALALATALGGLTFLIIRLVTDPMKRDLADIQADLKSAIRQIKAEPDLQRMMDVTVSDHRDKCPGATVPTNGKARRRVRAAVLAGAAGVLVLAASGCVSTITPVRDETGRVVRLDSYKIPFSPDLSYSAEWDELAPDGKTVLHRKESYSSQTTADRLAGVLGSLAGIYDKVKP